MENVKLALTEGWEPNPPHLSHLPEWHHRSLGFSSPELKNNTPLIPEDGS